MEVMHDHNYMYYINIMIPDMFHIYQNLYHSLGTLQFSLYGLLFKYQPNCLGVYMWL